MKRYLYIFGVISVLGIFALILKSSTGADFFSSMTKADYVEGSKTLKFTTKLNSAHVLEVTKLNPSSEAAFNEGMKKFIDSNFDVYVNGEQKTLTFSASQVSGETVWVYFEASGISDIKTLKIKNTIFLNNFPKQLNLVNVAYKGQQKTMNFQRGKEVNEVAF